MLHLQGFSLFELLITITIIGILTAMALPAYTEHITHEHRVEAEIALEKLSAGLEEYNTLNSTYENATLSLLNIPESVADQSYQLKIINASDTNFLISAVPLGKQAEKDSPCGTLTLNNAGEKGITGQSTVVDCW